MIVTALADATLVVTQADHARLAADLLSLLRLPDLVSHPRRAALLAAVAEHDNGWWESDAAPRFDPATRRPVDFRAVSDAERREIWLRGVERYAAADPYRAALVAGHGLRLLDSGRVSGEAWADFLAFLRQRREELAGLAAVSVDELRRDDRWLELGDELALAASTGDAAFCRRDDLQVTVAATAEEVRLALAPFPLAGSTRFELSCRRLALDPRGSDVELARELATARWERRGVRLVPLA